MVTRFLLCFHSHAAPTPCAGTSIFILHDLGLLRGGLCAGKEPMISNKTEFLLYWTNTPKEIVASWWVAKQPRAPVSLVCDQFKSFTGL